MKWRSSKRRGTCRFSPVRHTSLPGSPSRNTSAWGLTDITAAHGGDPISALTPALFAIDPTTGARTPLNAWTKLRLSPIRNSPGAITIDYPAGAPGFDTLHTGVGAHPPRALQVEAWLGGDATGALRGYLLRKGGDSGWTFGGHSASI